MVRVLLVGYDPEAVDYSNPAYTPGMTAEKISAGIALTRCQPPTGTKLPRRCAICLISFPIPQKTPGDRS